jgi:hypothetical protein
VKIVATVNGAAITERDLEHRANRPGMRAAPGHGAADGPVLETVVREEILYQKAMQLGLDRDPAYRLALDDLQAQLRVYQRQQMAGRLRAWVQEQAAVSDAEAREWFEKNAALVRTRFHALQIRGRLDEVLADQAALKAGAPFEEVARRRFEGMPPPQRPPWDLGELHWNQLPPQWRGLVDRLEPGQVSDVIRMEGERAWLIKLAGKRIDPTIGFDAERERILAALRQQKADELYARVVADAQAQAQVVYRPRATAATAARHGGAQDE